MKIINENEKSKIMETKPPSFTMKILSPIAGEIARWTSPSQIEHIAERFGFKENAETSDEVCGVILRMFKELRRENNDKDIVKIIETLLNLYVRASLFGNEELYIHDKRLISPIRELLREGHFSLGFDKTKKDYIIKPFDGAVHGIVTLAEGKSEQDFQDEPPRKMRVSLKDKVDTENNDSKKLHRYPKSLHLITESVAALNTIWLVLDERYNRPIRFSVNNNKGKETYIKKLYNISYFINAPRTRVDYDEVLANSINNSLFKVKQIADYIKSNNLDKPTIVKKSGDILVLRSETPVYTILIKNVPQQYRNIYTDKTK